MTPKQISKIEEELLEWFENTKAMDPEGAHAYADEILKEALKRVGMRKLVKRFDKLEKWYA
jgi:hypothetical protein